ncbi:RusA family crossover junction endodeoxyribonuclease [Gloeomargarita lithophora]|nr:RusA family crossover junction endodeoxyribonuclease [Gloeomargarita lithophora]
MPVVLTWPGEIRPKARPRSNFASHAVYTDPAYRSCQGQMAAAFMVQAAALGWTAPLLNPVAVHLILEGKHPRRCDGDNTLGAVLDALQMADLLRNDNLKAVPDARVTLLHSGQPPTATIHIAKFNHNLLLK